MYAIIATGGKQYRVTQGDVIDIELLPESEGNEVVFKEILLLNDGSQIQVGTPHVGGSVKGKVLGEIKGPKVIAYKYKRRKNYKRKIGHRQRKLRLEITEVKGA